MFLGLCRCSYQLHNRPHERLLTKGLQLVCAAQACVERLTVAGIDTLKPAALTLLGCFFFVIALSIPGAFGFNLLNLVVPKYLGAVEAKKTVWTQNYSI